MQRNELSPGALVNSATFVVCVIYMYSKGQSIHGYMCIKSIKNHIKLGISRIITNKIFLLKNYNKHVKVRIYSNGN